MEFISTVAQKQLLILYLGGGEGAIYAKLQWMWNSVMLHW